MRHEWDFPTQTGKDAARDARVADMASAMADLPAEDVLAAAFQTFGQKLALVSSFGADSIVLLHMAAQIDREFPVIFLDTRMLFYETLTYQTQVASSLGLKNVHRIEPDETVLRLSDAQGALHQNAPDDCCHIRKTLPLDMAMSGFEASVTGRKRYQTGARASMAVVDMDHEGRARFNPLASWVASDIQAYMERHDLPAHPLVASGFRSIGCAPCTTSVGEGEDPRAGRWRDQSKTECGIHFGPNGLVRGNG